MNIKYFFLVPAYFVALLINTGSLSPSCSTDLTCETDCATPDRKRSVSSSDSPKTPISKFLEPLNKEEMDKADLTDYAFMNSHLQQIQRKTPQFLDNAMADISKYQKLSDQVSIAEVWAELGTIHPTIQDRAASQIFSINPNNKIQGSIERKINAINFWKEEASKRIEVYDYLKKSL